MFDRLKKIGSGIKDRWIRATELADAAKGKGNWKLYGEGRGVTPEFGVGEFLRGFTGANIHEADAKDPKFVKNLKTQIERDVKPENQEVFKQDLEADRNRQKEEWLAKTANSPAAKAGMSDERRWKTHLKNQSWRKEQGRNYTHGDFL